MTKESKKRLPKQLFAAALIISATFLIIVLLLVSRPDKTSESEPLAAVLVQSLQIERLDLQPNIEITGRLQPANRALLRFELSGQIAKRYVEPGQAVEKEDKLLSMDDGDANDALIQAQAKLDMELAAIKRDRQLLKISGQDKKLQLNEVHRLEKLDADSLISASRLDQARQRLLQLESAEAQLQYSVDTAKARLTANQAVVAGAQRNLLRTSLRAPFAGRVNTVGIEVGDYVTPAKIAVELVDLSEMDFYAEISGATAVALHLQQMITVTINGHELEGEVIAVRSDPDPSTFTHALRIRLPGQGLLSGGLAHTRLPLLALKSVIAVPVASVLQEDGHSYVFVIHKGQLQRREVTRGIRHLDQLVISQGLREGEAIVASDVATLSHQQQVRVSQ